LKPDADSPPKLLLHCCCAPCASYVLEYLSQSFDVTAFFYNPNIYPRAEYDKRLSEMSKLLAMTGYPDMLIGEYDIAAFAAVAKPFVDEPEGGRRCAECFKLRLSKTARRAQTSGFDLFTTALSVSPHKNAALLNEIGAALAVEYGVKYLHSDFKKNDGYKHSIVLSKQYGLYRQSYCGCFPKVL